MMSDNRMKMYETEVFSSFGIFSCYYHFSSFLVFQIQDGRHLARTRGLLDLLQGSRLFHLSLLAGGALARTNGGSVDKWFDWLDSLTEIFTNSTLASFLKTPTGLSLTKTARLQHPQMLTTGIYKRSKILTERGIWHVSSWKTCLQWKFSPF